MQGRSRILRAGRLLLLLTATTGCGDKPPGPEPAQRGTRFDAAATGTLTGRVRWEGPAPKVLPFLSPPRPLGEPPRGARRAWDNPNAPLLGPDGGLGDVVVFLRGVDPTRACPWPWLPPRVELNGYRIHVHQGGPPSRFGFVPQGGPVELLSTDPAAYSLNVRGAAFFTLSFPDPDRPSVRTLRDKGVVELSSGSGQFWMRAYLFVDDHPYYARTGSDGRFTLPLVPEGDYELVCWLPNWHPGRRERDPDSSLTTRLYFRPAVELVRKVAVRRGRERHADFAVSTEMFVPRPSPEPQGACGSGRRATCGGNQG